MLLPKLKKQCNIINGIISVISSDPPCKDGNVQFTTVPLKTGKLCNFAIIPLCPVFKIRSPLCRETTIENSLFTVITDQTSCLNQENFSFKTEDLCYSYEKKSAVTVAYTHTYIVRNCYLRIY